MFLPDGSDWYVASCKRSHCVGYLIPTVDRATTKHTQISIIHCKYNKTPQHNASLGPKTSADGKTIANQYDSVLFLHRLRIDFA